MKIAKITIYNLASFNGKKEINFDDEPLRSADLFSIVGPTGSGKSTILDALCLALYGKTPRYASADRRSSYLNVNPDETSKLLAPNDSRNILKKGAKECYAEVVFDVNNCRYRARWSCRIARTAFSAAEQKLYFSEYNNGAYGDENEIDVKDSPAKRNSKIIKEIEKIIGLNYEQFTRTVMLAQNGFADFLKSKDEDKAEILEKLTDTGVFSAIARKIIDFLNIAKGEYMDVKSRYDALGQDLMGEEEKAETETKLKEIKSQIAAIDKQTEALKASLTWMDALNKLQGQMDKAKTDLSNAQKEYDENRESRAALSLYDAISPIKDTYNEWHRLCGEVQSLTKEIAEMDEKIKEANEEIGKNESHLNELKRQCSDCESTLNSKQSAIKLARTEKVNVDNRMKTRDAAEKEMKSAKDSLHNAEQSLKDSNKRNDELTAEIKRLDITLDSFDAHVDMFNKIEGILVKLDELNKSQTKYKDEETDIAKEKVDINENEKSLNKDKAKLDTIDEEIKRLNNLLKYEKNCIEGLDIDIIQQRLNDKNLRVNDIEDMCSTYRNIDSTSKVISENQSLISEWNAGKSNVENEKSSLEGAIKVLNAEHDDLITATAESVELLRQHLVDGKPCPVCGATHHPYSSEVMTPFKKKIEEMEKNINDKTDELKKKEKDIKKFESDIAHSQGTIESYQKQLKDYSDKKNDFINRYNELADASISDLENMLKNEKSEQETIKKDFKDYSAHSAKINFLQKDINKKNDEHDNIKSRFDKKKTEISNRHSALETRINAQTNIKNDIERSIADLDNDVSITEWQKKWQQSPQLFITGIKQINTQYCSAKKKKEEALQDKDKLTVRLEEQTKQVDKLNEDLKVKKSSYESCRNDYQSCYDGYMKILNGEDPDAYENNLKEALNKANEAMEMQRNVLESSKQTLTSLTSGRDTKRNTMTNDKQMLDNEKKKMDSWIEKFNRNNGISQINDDVIREYFSDGRDWMEVRNHLTGVFNILNSAKTSVDVMNKNIEDHLQSEHSTDLSREEINSNLNDYDGQKKSREEDKDNLLARLQSQHDKEKSMAGMIDELKTKKAEYEDWNLLRTGISGNSEGNAARNAVQCYSLKYLVFQANDQLKALNRRYSLEAIDGTLGINVIDHDQADMIRNVSSLSGGETFLVSLSLALALSQISSHNIGMENLFIDEGFGSLDTQSLQIVIDALSNLHSMHGKKVGVISHTPEIRERIHTQIRVKKHGNDGNSDLEIV
jgi:exonuclease SbcC